MRQILSTALVAVIVGALAGATMSAVAQAPAERAITPAAGINAASVDGKSAVGYTNKKNVRRGKLVATNKVGELPSNIVRPFWGYIKNKPGILADDQISWGEVMGTPAGFADGVDNAGVTGVTVKVVYNSAWIEANDNGFVDVACPPGSRVVGGGHSATVFGVRNVASFPEGNGWFAAFANTVSPRQTIDAFALCLSADGGNVGTAGRITTAVKPRRNK